MITPKALANFSLGKCLETSISINVALTPKAFPNFSLGLERQRQPQDLII
jgi:hypothetical protein